MIRNIEYYTKEKEVAQYKPIEYYTKELEFAEERYIKKLEEADIKSNATERHKKAEKILKNVLNYNMEYGVEKDGKLMKEGVKDKLGAMDYATAHHYKTSTYDRKAEHLIHYSKVGYEIVYTKKELKPEYKKEITKLLGKTIKQK